MRLQATAAGIEPALPNATAQPARRGWLKRLGALLGGGLLAGRAQASPLQTQGDGDYVGQIILFAGNFAPKNYAFCDGSILSIAQNTALYSLLGTTYGGNGQTTFGLPDLRGRAPIHAGQGPGLSPHNLGEMGGTETVTLTTSQLPPHNHTLFATSSPGTAATPTGNLLADDGRGGPQYASTGTSTSLSAQTIGATGGGQPHTNMPPYLALNYCICINGLYPSRN